MLCNCLKFAEVIDICKHAHMHRQKLRVQWLESCLIRASIEHRMTKVSRAGNILLMFVQSRKYTIKRKKNYCSISHRFLRFMKENLEIEFNRSDEKKNEKNIHKIVKFAKLWFQWILCEKIKKNKNKGKE